MYQQFIKNKLIYLKIILLFKFILYQHLQAQPGHTLNLEWIKISQSL